MSAEKKPVVAITIGDPAGIGPEITVATMMDKSVYDECKTVPDRLGTDYQPGDENHGLRFCYP